MNFIAINAGPRKSMNTLTLLNAAIERLKSDGHSVKLYHLYDLNFKGCYSCFACKKTQSPSYGKCIIKDDLKSIFEEIKSCDGLLMASPIYYRDVTGELRSFIERLLFQSMLYTSPPKSIFGKRINVGLIYTMNVLEEQFNKISLKPHLEGLENSLKLILGDPKVFYAFETNQLKSYEGIEYTYINPQERLKRHEENFPKEIERVKDFALSLEE